MSKPGKDQTGSTERIKPYFPRGQSFSVENIPFPKPQDQQSITINLFASLYPKADKPVQTDTSKSSLHDTAPRPIPDCPEVPLDIVTPNSEVREDNCLPESSKKSEVSVSDETDKSMEVRKEFREKDDVISRATSDLERRKLEAELKATEEIAKIQQTVIEKRLAFELATIHGDPEFQANVRPSFSPKTDLTDYEDWATNKQKLIQKKLALELDSLNHATGARPPLPPRAIAAETAGRKKGRPELIVNRAMGPPIRRKLSILGANSFIENELPPSNAPNFAGGPEVRYIAAPRNSVRIEEPRLSFSRPGQSVCNANIGKDYRNNGSFWRSMMTKMRRKFKSSKTPGPWE